jgi:hypothetical protein
VGTILARNITAEQLKEIAKSHKLPHVRTKSKAGVIRIADLSHVWILADIFDSETAGRSTFNRL